MCDGGICTCGARSPQPFSDGGVPADASVPANDISVSDVAAVHGSESESTFSADPGICRPPLRCETNSGLSPARARFFSTPVSGPRCEDNAPNTSPILPISIIQQLLRPLPQTDDRDQRPPPPPQTIVTLTDRSGLLEISNQYQTTYQKGRDALTSIYGNLETASQSQDPAEISRLLDSAGSQLAAFSSSAQTVQDVHTRYNLSEYATIEGWLTQLYGRYGSSSAPASTPLVNSSEMIRVEGVMLGFNLAAINKADPTYRTGTAVKLLIEHQARALATEWGGETRSLGLWGTNIVVAGVPERRTAEFRGEVERRVLEFLRGNQSLPPEIARQMGSERLQTSDLPGRETLLARPAALGLVAGHRSMAIDASYLQPNHPNYVRGQADIEIIRLLTGMAECEMEARRLGRSIFTGEVPTTSPIRGRAGRPLLTADAQLPAGSSPHTVTPLETPEPGTSRDPLPTVADIQSGRMRRPAQETEASIRQASRLFTLLSQASSAAQSGDLTEARRLSGEAMTYMNNPENRAPEQQPRSMLEVYEDGYRISLEQHRFPGVFRLELFPQIAQRTFNSERFFIQMAEYRDYWGHNRAHAPDASDSMHRLTMDILVRGYQYHGVEVLTGTQGGDEVFFAIRGRTGDGHRLTDADIARISDYLGTNFNRIFQNVDHHEVTKVPMLPGGRFEGRNYLLKDGQLYVEKGAYTAEQLTELREVVRISYNQTIDPANVKTVESLSKVGQVERLRLWSRVDATSGRVIEIFRPMGEVPEGFTEVRIPLSTTLTSAVEVPEGSPAEVVRLAMDRAGQQADEMKREGLDRPRNPSDPTSSGPDPITRIPMTERLNATRGGRLFLHGGMFAAGDILSEAALQLATGRSGLGSLDFYKHLVTGYAQMATGTYLGEGAGRAALAAWDRRLFVREGERLVLNGAAFRAEYTGLRGAGIRGAGILGAVLLTELMSRGYIDAREATWTLGSMGTAMASSRFLLWGTGATLEATGLISGTTRMALTRHPLTAVAVIATECLIMKGIQRLREGWAREETEASLRSRLGSAMRQLDYTIARNQAVRPDGTIDQAAQTEYQNATRAVTDAFGDYMMFQFAHNTNEGQVYQSAQREAAEAQATLDERLRKYPESWEKIQAVRRNPNAAAGEEAAIIAQICRYERSLTLARSLLGGGGMTNDPEGELRRMGERRDSTRAALQTSERDFQSSVRRRLQAAGPGSFYVPLHQYADGFQAGLRSDPVEIYQQFQNYLTTRMAYADQVQAQGPDVAALEGHYAPPPPVRSQPRDFRILLDPRPQSPNLWEPLPGLGNPNLFQPLAPLDVNTLLQRGGTSVFILPAESTHATESSNNMDLLWLQPTDENQTGRPLFYLDGDGRIRPMRASDQFTAGAVWFFNTETRRFEVRNDPVIAIPAQDGTNSNLPVLDLSDSLPRPLAQPNGEAQPVITIDRRGPRPTYRFTR